MDTASAGGASAPAQPNDQGMGIAHDDNTSDRQTQESELAKMWFQNLVKAGAAPHGGGCGGNEKDMAEHVYDAIGGGGAQPQGEVVADDDAVFQEPLQLRQMGDEEDATLLRKWKRISKKQGGGGYILYLCMCVCLSVCLSVCTHTHIHSYKLYIHTYIHTFSDIHTYIVTLSHNL